MLYRSALVLTIVFIFNWRYAFGVSNELRAFQKACNEIKAELRNMKPSLRFSEHESELRKRRRTLNKLVSSFYEDPKIPEELEDGEEWYREFRARESADGRNSEESGNLQIGNSNDEDERSTDSWFIDSILKNGENGESGFDSNSVGESVAKRSNVSHKRKLKNHVNGDDNDVDYFKDRSDSRTVYDDFYKRNQFQPRIFAYTSDFSGPLDSGATETNTSRNDLSHEANYELSKIEQDEAEKQKGTNLGASDRSHSIGSTTNPIDDGDPFKCETLPTLRPVDDEEGTTHDKDSESDGRNSAPSQLDNSHKNDAREGSGSNASDQFNGNDSETRQNKKNYVEEPPSSRYNKAHNFVEKTTYHDVRPSFKSSHQQSLKHGTCVSAANRYKPEKNELRGDQNDQYTRENSESGDRVTNENQSNSRHFSEGHSDTAKNSEKHGSHDWKHCKKPENCKSWNSVSAIVKRNFNPINEIKLKTSRRLMRKGFGPSLPSYSLEETKRERKLDELLRLIEQGGKEKSQNGDMYTMGENSNGLENVSPYHLTDIVTDNPRHHNVYLGDGQDLNFGLVRTKRVSRVGDQQLKQNQSQFQESKVRKERSKRDVPQGLIKVSNTGKNFGKAHKDRYSVKTAVNKKDQHEDYFRRKGVQFENELFKKNLSNIIRKGDCLKNFIQNSSESASSFIEAQNSQMVQNTFDSQNNEELSINGRNDQLLLNSTGPHKIQKRAIHQIPGLSYSRSFRNIPNKLASMVAPRGHRQDSFDDANARRIRNPAADFTTDAGIRPFALDVFDGLSPYDSLLSEDPNGFQTFNEKTSNNRIYSRESDKAVAKPQAKLNINNNTSKVSNHTKENINCTTTKSPPKQSGPSEVSIKTNEVSGAGRQLLLSLKEGVLNSTAYSQLENMLKNCKGLDEDIITVNNENVTESTKKPAPLRNDTITSPDHKKDECVKLNITIDASVTGNEDSNNFVGNGTINVRPGYTEDRERRSSMFAEFDPLRNSFFEKRRIKEKDDQEQMTRNGKGGNDYGFELYGKLDSVLNGQAAADVVDGVLKALESDRQLRVLLQTLNRNKRPQKTNLSEKGLLALHVRENEPDVYHTEQFMGQMMSSINRLIDRQLRVRSCISLNPDLAKFYELILRTLAARETQRKKREYRIRSLASDFSKAVRAIDPNKIEEKSRVVKKLLKEYDSLPLEDKRQASDMRNDLLMDLAYLRKIRASQEILQDHHKREVMRNLFKMPSADSDVVKEFEEKYTPKFVKLLKMADFFKDANAEI